jgi:TPR repeat protein
MEEMFRSEGFPALAKHCEAGDGVSCVRVAFIRQRELSVIGDDVVTLLVDEAGQPIPGAAEKAAERRKRNLGIRERLEAEVRATWRRAQATVLAECGTGNSAACAALGWMYQEGYGVPADPHRALEFYTKGCQAGNPWACGPMTKLGGP